MKFLDSHIFKSLRNVFLQDHASIIFYNLFNYIENEYSLSYYLEFFIID